jgi:hypothetical protein
MSETCVVEALAPGRSPSSRTSGETASADLVIEAADANRCGGVIATTSRVRVEPEEVAVTFADGVLTPAAANAAPDATAMAGPAGFDGNFIRCAPNAGVVEVGASLADWARAVHVFADEQWGTGSGGLQSPGQG